MPGRRSDDQGQFGERLGEATPRRYVGPEIVEAPAEVLDESVPGDDDLCGAVSLQSAHRAQPGFQTAVVGLDRVVRMDLRAVQRRWDDLVQDPRVGAVPVGRDLNR